jgi:antitoxin component YwqK of YwqJK toxin-antitoxin module
MSRSLRLNPEYTEGYTLLDATADFMKKGEIHKRVESSDIFHFTSWPTPLGALILSPHTDLQTEDGYYILLKWVRFARVKVYGLNAIEVVHEYTEDEFKQMCTGAATIERTLNDGTKYHDEYPFLGGIMHGLAFEKDAEGNTISATHYLNGRRGGLYVENYTDTLTTKTTGMNVNGKPFGPWFEYHRNGMQAEQCSYDENGHRVGNRFLWDENGNLYKQMKYQDNTLNGACISYYHDPFPNPNPLVMQIRHFKDGFPHGMSRFLDKHGNTVKDELFDMGNVVETHINA